jgi:NAD(P)-dependent dehydrogenase (short-subunit alcohol dehydrogenase family)
VTGFGGCLPEGFGGSHTTVMATRYDVEGLVIVVAGGTTGLGLSAARLLTKNGARVLVAGRSQKSLEAALEQLGDHAAGVCADLTHSSAADAMITAAVQRWGRVDGLYHVAGGSGRRHGDGPVHEMTDEGWTFTTELNLTSVAWTNRAMLRQLMHQGGGGVILNMSSVLGWSPSPAYFASHAYAAAKAGIIGMSQAAASYYAKADIRINVIAPALVETPMSTRACENAEIQDFISRKQPLDGGRVGVPEDVDGAAVFMLSRAARFMTGQVIAVDGGWTVSEGVER